MLRVLSKILFLFFICQIFSYSIFDIYNYDSSLIRIATVEGGVSILILLFSLSYMVLLSNKLDKVDINLFIVDDRKSTIYIEMAIIIFFCSLLIYLTPSISSAYTLNASQAVPYIGYIFKISTVILPSFSFVFYLRNREYKYSFLILIFSFLCSSYTGMVFLTKQPVFPYLLFFILTFKSFGKKIKSFIIFLFLLALSSVLFIYSTRSGESGEHIGAIIKIIERFVLYKETLYIVNFLSNHSPLYLTNIWDFAFYITRDVFGYDPYYIGIAPGLIGLFLINYGYLGVIILAVFITLVFLFLNVIRSNDYLGGIIYFMFSCEFIAMFTDGNPTFYTSTTNGSFFYILIFIATCNVFKKYFLNKKERFIKIAQYSKHKRYL